MHKSLFSFRRRALAACMAAALLAVGCASTQAPYAAPNAPIPASWIYANGAVQGASTDPWWKNFRDPVLDSLIAEALSRNSDLAAAAIRVRRAQLQAGLAADALTPRLSSGVGVNASRPLDGGNSSRSSSVSLGASYEVDLWNRLGSQRDVAEWEVRATEQDRESAALAVIGTTASLYWQIGYLNQRLATSGQSIDYAQKTLDLVRAQYRAGAVSGLEVAQAEQSVASQRASQTQLEQQRVETTTALSLLFGESPGMTARTLPQVLPPADLPEVAAGLPADLLGRRPDLRAAEWRLRESFTNIDVTRKSYYPTLSLTGSLGSSSAALLNVLQNPVLALGVGLSLPFLQRTEMDLNIKVSQTQYEEAVVTFRQTLYKALGDVENALSARTQYLAQATLLEQSLAAARRAESLSEIQYRAGSVPLKSWLDAQEKRRAAEITLTENRLNRLVNHVTIYQALGGDAVALRQ